MKQLKIILGFIYPFLIILLCISNCKRCEGSRAMHSRIEEPADTTIVIIEPDDTASVVEQAQHTGQSGNLKVTLLWNFQGDIDLHVTQPNGKTIYYKESKDLSTGGFLDVDNRDGGNGSAENIFWANPPKGKYKVSLVYYQASHRTDVAESGICSVVVFQEGKEPKTYQVEMRTIKEKKDVVELNIE